MYLHHTIPTLICCFRFRLVSLFYSYFADSKWQLPIHLDHCMRFTASVYICLYGWIYMQKKTTWQYVLMIQQFTRSCSVSSSLLSACSLYSMQLIHNTHTKHVTNVLKQFVQWLFAPQLNMYILLLVFKAIRFIGFLCKLYRMESANYATLQLIKSETNWVKEFSFACGHFIPSAIYDGRWRNVATRVQNRW